MERRQRARVLAHEMRQHRHGREDAAPPDEREAGPPRQLQVLDDRTIAVPERVGNRRVDGFRNILTKPHVGLIHLIPGRDDTLRINGRARIVRDAPFLDDMAIAGRRPFQADEVARIVVHGSQATVDHVGWPYRPESVTAAQMNLPFCVATLLAEGDVFVEQLSDAVVVDPRSPTLL